LPVELPPWRLLLLLQGLCLAPDFSDLLLISPQFLDAYGDV
jgi:hypothetical protein